MAAQLTSDSNGTGGAILWDAYVLYDAERDVPPDQPGCSIGAAPSSPRVTR